MTRPAVEETIDSPTNIPGYELLDLVGEGGTGRVFRARQLSLQRVVAIKLFSTSPGHYSPAAFNRETHLLASLVHPNLVTVFDCGEVNGHSYIVTEFVEGSTLRKQMAAGNPWPVERAAYMLDRLATALSYIHAKGILHLDLKPENILCDAAGEPKIADFGLALKTADVSAEVDREETQGTPDYCPPEQRFGLPTNERSDLFSLAVISYELLTGSLPGRVYESARPFNPQLPRSVDRVLCRGLSRSQEDRFATVEEFRRELLAALRIGVSSYRRWLGLLAAVTLTLALSIALLWPSPPRPSEPLPPVLPEPLQSWVLHDSLEQLRWFDLEEATARPWLVEGRAVGASGSPPVPAWPLTRPVMVIASGETMGFVHPLTDPSLGRRVLKAWPALTALPSLPPENNFCLAGNFAGDCLAPDHEDKTRPWHLIDPAILKTGNLVGTADPPDRPGNPALFLHKKDSFSPVQEIGCYQWLPRVPDRPGTVVVLRYKARAEEGEGRLTVRLELPIVLPAGSDEPTRRLRDLSFPFPSLPHDAAEEPRQYRIEDWVTPSREWRSYYVIWEWPPYCHLPDVRNVVVLYSGIGKVWLDDLEVYTWELGKLP